MQNAARTVVEENQALRALLSKRGVSTAEIEDHLASARQVSNGASAPLPAKDAFSSGLPYERRRHCAPLDANHATRPRLPDRGLRPEKGSSRGYSPTPEAVTSNAVSGTLYAGSQSNPASADETSCENAARIIASMRGHEDSQALRPELGCTETNTCMVKNMIVFQLADR